MNTNVGWEQILCNAFLKKCNLNFTQNPELKSEKLFGSRIHLQARDLLCVLMFLEEEHESLFSHEEIKKESFDTFDHILELLIRKSKTLSCT